MSEIIEITSFSEKKKKNQEFQIRGSILKVIKKK